MERQLQLWLIILAGEGRDPLTGPIVDVVNFLAYLYSEGYQLNAYRSAIPYGDKTPSRGF